MKRSISSLAIPFGPRNYEPPLSKLTLSISLPRAIYASNTKIIYEGGPENTSSLLSSIDLFHYLIPSLINKMINNKVELYFSSSSIRPTLKKEKEKRLFSSTNFEKKRKSGMTSIVRSWELDSRARGYLKGVQNSLLGEIDSRFDVLQKW